MSNYISINIQPTQSPSQSIHHSNRSTYISYLVSEPETITTYRHELESANLDKSDLDRVGQYFELRTADISEDYKLHNQRTIQKNTKLYHEAVVSFGRERFEQNSQSDILESLEKFCNNFEQKYNVRVLMSSLHLDEGHKDEDSKIQYNYHAHILIENYSFRTHKTGMRTIDYKKLQTELANEFQHLGFERGDPERKAQRLEHKQYREAMEQKQGLAEEIYNEHYEPLEKNYEQLKTQVQPLVNQAFAIAKEQNKEIKTYEDMTNILEERFKTLEVNYKQAREELKATKQAKQSDYTELKKEFEQSKEQIKTEIAIIKKQQETTGKRLYKNELQEQNPKLSKLITFPDLEHSNRFVIQAPLKSETTINKLLETLQETAYKIQEIQTPKYVEKIIEKPVIKEVEKIIEKEIIKEIPKYVDKIIEVEKRVEKPVIVDFDENKRLREQIKNIEIEKQNLSKQIAEQKTEKGTEILKRYQVEAENRKLSSENLHLSSSLTVKTNTIKILEKTLATKSEELNEVKIENSALLTAVERFLELNPWKGIKEVTKTAVERLNSFFDRFKTQELQITPVSIEEKQEKLVKHLREKSVEKDYFEVVNMEKCFHETVRWEHNAQNLQRECGQGTVYCSSSEKHHLVFKLERELKTVRISKEEYAELKHAAREQTKEKDHGFGMSR